MPSSELALAQRRRNVVRARAKVEENRRLRREQWRAEARTLWEQWQHDPLFMLGVGLYWGEGSKERSKRSYLTLALSNSDVRLLRIWLRWCQRFLHGVPLNYELHIHDPRAVDAARAFWKQELGIAVTWVCVAVSSASKRKRDTLPYGTLKVRVGRGSVEWWTKMMVWLELAQSLEATTQR